MTSRRKKWLVPVIVWAAVMAMVSGGFAESEMKASGKTLVISILEGFMSDTEVAIERGTTVIWYNDTDKAVDVNFTMGKKVQQACVVPVGFKLDRDGYNASNIPPGGVASLCFVKDGTYNYVVNTPGGSGGEGAPPPTGMIAVMKDLRYDPPETSWVDISNGWNVIPGLIEPPFEIRTRDWGPPLHKKGNPSIWAFDYPKEMPQAVLSFGTSLPKTDDDL